MQGSGVQTIHVEPVERFALPIEKYGGPGIAARFQVVEQNGTQIVSGFARRDGMRRFQSRAAKLQPGAESC